MDSFVGDLVTDSIWFYLIATIYPHGNILIAVATEMNIRVRYIWIKLDPKDGIRIVTYAIGFFSNIDQFI